jgi:hypothetical protein
MEIPAKDSHHMFVGKTIEAFDATCCNQIEFRFTDGTKAVLHIEADSSLLLDVLACSHCAERV